MSTTGAEQSTWRQAGERIPSGARRAGALAWRGFQRAFIYSSIWAAGSVAALTWFACHIMDVPAAMPALLVFCSALFVYNLDHVADAHVQKMSDAEAITYFRSPGVLALLSVAAVATGWLVSTAPLPAQACFATYATAGLLYGLPIVPFPKRQGGWRLARLKEIPFSKGWLVGGCITIGTVLMPAMWAGRELDWAVGQLALFIFVFVSSNTHMFDVRDIDNDREHRVLTLPVAFGVRRTKHALILLNLVLLACLMWGWASQIAAPHPEMVLSSVAAVLWILLLNTKTPRSIYGTLIDGCCYLPAMLVQIHHAGF